MYVWEFSYIKSQKDFSEIIKKGKVFAGLLPVVWNSELFSGLAFPLRLDLFDGFFKVAHHHVRFRSVLCGFFRGRELCKVFMQYK
jgi:hypothetical protein